MTITFNPTLLQFMFVSEMAILKVKMDPSTEFALTILKDAEQIFNATYLTDTEGNVTIYDLDRVFDYHTRVLPTSFLFRITIGASSYAYPMQMFKSRVAVDNRATDFIQDFFLSPVTGDRDTAIGRIEMLTAYIPTATDIETYCTYYKDGKVWEEVWGGSNDRGLYDIIAKVSAYARDDAQLVGFRHVIGNREMRYRVLDYTPKVTEAFLYRNCFGVMETIYFTGTKEVMPSYTRGTSYIDGLYVNYKVRDEMIYKINTGVMRSSMEQALLDLARSEEVYLLQDNGAPGYRVTITDCDVKHDNADDELLEANYTYRVAQRFNSELKDYRRPQIFDDTFDTTYE